MGNTTFEPPIKQQIKETKELVEQTWEDLDDIGKTIDTMAGNSEEVKKIFKRLYLKQISIETTIETTIKKTIAEEVAKQIEPLQNQLNEFLITKPKVVYIGIKLPNPFRWFMNLIYGKHKK